MFYYFGFFKVKNKQFLSNLNLSYLYNLPSHVGDALQAPFGPLPVPHNAGTSLDNANPERHENVQELP